MQQIKNYTCMLLKEITFHMCHIYQVRLSFFSSFQYHFIVRKMSEFTDHFPHQQSSNLQLI